MMAFETGGRARAVVPLVIALVIGIAFGFILDGGGDGQPSHSSPPSETTLGPNPLDVPTGYPRTEAGAVAAATNFNLLGAKDELLDEGALAEAMRTLAAPGWADDAETEGENGYEYVVETYGSDADVGGAVLGYEITKFDGERATVRLWLVSTLSGSERPDVEAAWGIVTTDLVWLDGAWRVAGIESSPGPAPIQLPSGESRVTARHVMEEFDEFRGAPVP